MSLDHYSILSSLSQMSGEDIEYIVNTKRTYNGISGIDKYRLQKETVFINGMEYVVRRLCSTSFESGPYGVVGWVIDEDIERCMICGEDFGFFRHRHHCRACGNIVCYVCSPEEAVIAEIRELGEQRVCIQCFWGQDPVEAKHSRIVDVVHEQATKRWTQHLQSDASSTKSPSANHTDYWSDGEDRKTVVPKRRYTYKEDDSDGDEPSPVDESAPDNTVASASSAAAQRTPSMSSPDNQDSTSSSTSAVTQHNASSAAVPTEILKSTEENLATEAVSAQAPPSPTPARRKDNSSAPKHALNHAAGSGYAPLEAVDASEQEEALKRSEAQHRTSNHVPFDPNMATSSTAIPPSILADRNDGVIAIKQASGPETASSLDLVTTRELPCSASDEANAVTGTSSTSSVSDTSSTQKHQEKLSRSSLTHVVSSSSKTTTSSSTPTTKSMDAEEASSYTPLETVDATEDDLAVLHKEAQHRTSNHVPFIPNTTASVAITSASAAAVVTTPSSSPSAISATANAQQTIASTTAKTDTKFTQPKTNATTDDSTVMASPSQGASPITNVSVTPQPVCVLKSRRAGGEKVFVNVLSFPMQLALGSKSFNIDKDIVWLHGNCKKSKDKNGDECLAYDVVISDGMEKDTALGTMSLQQLGMRVISEINIQYQDTLAMEFTTPKIRNNYKGDGPTAMMLFATNGKLFDSKLDAEKYSMTQKEDDPTEIRFLRTNSIPDNPLPEGIPAPHSGYLKKEGHIIRNWKRRYFTLIGGILHYYEKSNKDGGGEKLKGELSLKGAVVNTSGSDKEYDSKKLYITAGEKGKDLFLEADSPTECVAWRNALFMHIEYATNNPEFIETPRDSKASRASIFG